MTKAHNNAPLNPRELENPGVGVPGDEGIVDGAPDGGTDHNYSAPPPKAKSTESGDLTGATSTHDGAGGQMEQTGGDGTAPTVVK
jgi:hypothetical protein